MPKSRRTESAEASCIIGVQAVPRSSRTAIELLGGGNYKVRLTSPPVDGAANEQLLKILSKALSIPVRNLQIVSGETSRQKRIRVSGIDLDQTSRRLAIAANK
jgi:uncharacterized protein (TIGR00251 family)